MKSQAGRWIRVIMVVAFLVPLLSSQLLGGQKTPPPTPPATTEQAVDFLRARRADAEYLVQTIKASAPEDVTARQLYEQARHYYNAYVEAVLFDIRSGRRKSNLQETAGRAGKAMEEFEKYSAKFRITPSRMYKKAAALAAVLVEVGFQIWEYYSKEQEKKRKAIADDLKEQLEWQAWEFISRPSATPG